MRGDSKRVLLVNPGELLLIGNVGPLSAFQTDVIRQAFNDLRLDVILFEADIDIDSIPVAADEAVTP